MSTISTHVLDTGVGKPVAGMDVTLFSIVNGQRRKLATQRTNANGRIEKWGGSQEALQKGTYCLHFSTEPYFLNESRDIFYPYVEVTFHIDGQQPNYHIPLVLSLFGYMIYRGT